MTDQELRQLVRDAIARAGARPVLPDGAVGRILPEPAARLLSDPAFGLLKLPVGADSDGPCIIEPAVACNHCGFCKSYGH
jgi:hypothetical protein